VRRHNFDEAQVDAATLAKNQRGRVVKIRAAVAHKTWKLNFDR
jgi:hypothetical protein